MTLNRLNTTYLGLQLRSPLVVSASPLSEDIANIRQMEDCGAGAIVLFSLFEEQVRREQQVRSFIQAHPAATWVDPQLPIATEQRFHTDLDGYLAHVRKAKAAVQIPIIASLNCTSLGSWTECAQKIAEAGADALELNIYFIPTDMDSTSEQVEALYIDILKVVKAATSIPVAVKLSPFFTNMISMARRLDRAGANALVLFNRFYQPDFDPATLQVQSSINLSTSQDLRLPLHWIALLNRHVRADLAATGGIHTAEDVVKMLMVGARVTMMASVLLNEGIDRLRSLEQSLQAWLDENNYASIAELQGLVSQFNSKDPSAFERTEYLRAITSFKPVS